MTDIHKFIYNSYKIESISQHKLSYIVIQTCVKDSLAAIDYDLCKNA